MAAPIESLKIRASGPGAEVRPAMPIVASFIAGFLSTLIFHQGLVALLAAGGAPVTPYNMSATWPLTMGADMLVPCIITCCSSRVTNTS